MSYRPPPNRNTQMAIAITERMNVEGFIVEILRYNLLKV
jgi:hypothetical protein